MKQKKIVTIQDISCFGKCSLTVALPIVSAMGIGCAIIPTAVLSTHTGGFKNFTFHDLTDEIEKIADHWEKSDIAFDGIYTGYLGSDEQIRIVSDFFDKFNKDGKTLVFVDPAMADNGKLYTGFGSEFPLHMAKLCAKADIIDPNLTEAAFMLGEEYKDSYDMDYIYALAKRLCEKLGCKTAVVTGVKQDDRQGVVAYNSETGEYCEYFGENQPVSYHGTGDVFSAALMGALTLGKTMSQAIKIAVDYTIECIKATAGDDEHWYGVKFEQKVKFLVDSL